MHLLVGDTPNILRVIALVDYSNLISLLGQMTIDGVVAGIQLSVQKPGDISLLEGARAHLRVGREELDVFGSDLCPYYYLLQMQCNCKVCSNTFLQKASGSFLLSSHNSWYLCCDGT